MLHNEVVPHEKAFADNWLTCMKLTDTCFYPAPRGVDVARISATWNSMTEYDNGGMEGLPPRPREEGGKALPP